MLPLSLIATLILAPALPLTEDFESAESLAKLWPAAVDGLTTSQPHDGKHCLQVVSGDGQPHYLSLFIPVEAGKWYHGAVWIRCQGVVASAAGNMNRGAVIFGQFAGAEQEWIGGGSFPKGLRGDQDWTRCEFAYTRRIPDNVKYLQLMLGVEGQGTAWFDGLEVNEVTSTPGPPIVAPADGATVDVQRPELVWQTEDGVKALYGVELCRDRSFEHDVIQSGVGRDRTRTTEPLSPGRWYWRILRQEGSIEPPPTTPSSFIVAASAKLWPPILEPQWCWTAERRPVLACRVGPAGNRYVLELTIDGQRAQPLPPDQDLHRWQPTADLTPDLHEVVVTCAADGETATVTGVLNTKPPGSEVMVGEGGNLVVDREPFFPLAAYRDPSDTLTDFSGLKEAGFNTTHSYAFEAAGTLEQARAYLQAADQAGLKVFLGLHRQWVRERDNAAMERWAAELMDEPALLTWYEVAEPAAQGVPVELLAAMYDAIKRMDPFHPASLLLVREKAFESYSPHCDIFWTDPYPVGRNPLTMVSDRTRKARLAAKGKPVWTVLQAFDWSYWPDAKGKIAADGQPAVPTEAQSRVMAHLALAEGALGLVWYWQPNSRWHIQQDAPQVWAGVKQVVGELRDLTPYLLAPRRLNDDLGLSEPAMGWSSAMAGQHVMVIINPGDADLPTVVPLPGVRTVTMPDRTQRTVEQGKLPLTLEPLQVMILRWSQ